MAGTLVSLPSKHTELKQNISFHINLPNIRENIRKESQKVLRELTYVKVHALRFKRGWQTTNVTSGARSHDPSLRRLRLDVN